MTRRFCDDGSKADGFSSVRTGSPLAERPAALTVDGSRPFVEHLVHVAGRALEAYAHRAAPFERVLARLQPARDGSRTPLFDVMFDHRATLPASLGLAGLASSRLVPEDQLHTGTSKVDLAFYSELTPQDFSVSAEFRSDLFDARTIDLWLERFDEPVGRRCSGSEAEPPIGSTIAVLSEDEHRRPQSVRVPVHGQSARLYKARRDRLRFGSLALSARSPSTSQARRRLSRHVAGLTTRMRSSLPRVLATCGSAVLVLALTIAVPAPARQHRPSPPGPVLRP